MIYRRTMLATTCVISSFGFSSVTFAQSTTPERGAQLEEIIVTAQKRDENLQKVPVAITAITAQAMAARGITSVLDLGAQAPGLSVTQVSGSTILFMRGVGNNNNSIGDEASVSLYVDGVYLPSIRSSIFSFTNVDRVEALKGPQGTLFGRNATGGLVNVITKTPSQKTSLDASVDYETYQTVKVSGYGTTGLSDNLAMDLAVFYSDQGDAAGQNFTTGHGMSQGDEFDIRSKLLFTPSDRTKITLTGTYLQQTSSWGMARNGLPGEALTGGYIYRGGDYDTPSDRDPYYRFRTHMVSADVQHEFDAVKFRSISAYFRERSRFVVDFDATPAPIFSGTLGNAIRMYSQEFQLSSNNESRLKWIAGLFYYNNEAVGDVLVPGFYRRYTDQNFRSLAAFGQASYEVLSDTHLTVGARYTADRINFHGNDTSPTTGALTMLYPKSTVKKSVPTWRIALDHNFSGNVLGYASYSRGYKSGSYNSGSPGQAPTRPEKLDAYEIGSKADLLDRRLRVNTAAYYYNYKDLQLLSFDPNKPGSTLIYNAAKARIKGVEISVDAVPTRDLTLNGGFSYTDAKYRSFPGAIFTTPRPTGGNIVTLQDGSGKQVVRTPKFTATAGGTYTVPLEPGDVRFSVNYVYNGGFFWGADNRVKQKAYSLVNTDLSFTTSDGHWSVHVYAKNLFDTRYYTYLDTSSSLGDTGAVAKPRIIGAGISRKFN